MEPLDEPGEAVVKAQVAVVLEAALLALLARLGEPGAPRVDAGDDPGFRGQAVPAGGADLRILAEEALPGDAGGRQELHHRAALEVPAHEAEQQREALRRRVDPRLALHEVRRDPRPLEGRGERRHVAGGVAEEDGRLARSRAGRGRLLHEPRDLHRLHRLACRGEDVDGRVEGRLAAGGGSPIEEALLHPFERRARLGPVLRCGGRGEPLEERAPARVVPWREGQGAGLGDDGERVVLAQGDQEVRSHRGQVVEAQKDDTADRAARERLRGQAVDRRPVEEAVLVEAIAELARRAGEETQALGVGRAGRQALEVLRPEAAAAKVLQRAQERGAEAGLLDRLLQVARRLGRLSRARGRGQPERDVHVLGHGPQALREGPPLGHAPGEIGEQQEADAEVPGLGESPRCQPGAEVVRGHHDRDREKRVPAPQLPHPRLQLADEIPHPRQERCSPEGVGLTRTRPGSTTVNDRRRRSPRLRTASTTALPRRLRASAGNRMRTTPNPPSPAA